MKKYFLTLVSTVIMVAATSCCNTKADKCAESGNVAAGDSIECASERKLSATPEEIAAISKPLDMYINASVQGDSNVAKPAFAQGATISHAEGDSLVCLPIQALFDYYDATGKQSASYEISECNVAEDVAIVRIESKFGETQYADMFTLVKEGDDWKIVSKVFHTK